MTGEELIKEERMRQIYIEGFDAENDSRYAGNDLEIAAACYAIAYDPDTQMPDEWPWALEFWKPKDRKRNLVRAGALYLAAADLAERCPNDLGISQAKSKMLRCEAQACAELIDSLKEDRE